ncbi:MAG: ABC-2 transporter permease [Lachnospiraceae bacterium]|nr:ABC-2 transporter permease [Lachnospiraceae bacterium]
MKGLLYKDFYSLKKELRTLLVVTTGVIIIAILLLLSMKHGNLAGGMVEMQAESRFSREELEEMLQLPIMIMLVIPIAFMANIIECFRADEKAGFYHVLHSMPLSVYQKIGARYLTCMLFAGISLSGAAVAALLISFSTDTMTFGEMFGCCMTFCSFFLLYMSIIMPFLYLFSAKVVERLQIVIFVVGLIVVEGIAAMNIFSLPEEEIENLVKEMMEKFIDFLKNGYFKLFLLAMVGFLISYVVSVKIQKSRKGKRA